MDMIRKAREQGERRIMLQAPCGFGKTVISSQLIKHALDNHQSAAFIVPALSLIDQTFDSFVADGIDPRNIGIMQAQHEKTNPHAKLQIISADTLARRKRPHADLILCDEAHRKAASVANWMKNAPEATFIGLSATPWAKGLGLEYTRLLKPASTRSLIDGGYLSDYQLFAPSDVDLSDVRTTAGDYNAHDLEKAMDKQALVGEIVSTWLNNSTQVRTLCFCSGVSHAKSILERFRQAGVPTEIITAHTPNPERQSIARRFSDGSLPMVVNVGCLTTGIDWNVHNLILARPTQSQMLYVQICGRALRTSPDKDRAMIFDHSSTSKNLGFPCEIDHDSMDLGELTDKERKAKLKLLELPKVCESCTALIPAGRDDCPACGKTLPKRQFEEHAGRLVELRRAGALAKPEPPKKLTVVEKLRLGGEQNTFSQLNMIAHKRGYKQQWTAHKFRSIFNSWPNSLRYAMLEPSPLLKSWVKSENIKFAKRKEHA